MEKTKIILTIFTVLLAGSIISAAGVASPYWETNPLNMNYGETKIIELNLQNMVGDEDITVKLIVKQGSDIATLEKDTYAALAGTSDTMIPLTITIPKNYNKDSQTIEIETKTVTPGQGGMVNLGTGWTTTFDVLLSEKSDSAFGRESDSSTGKIIALVIAIIVLILTIFFVMKRKRKA